MKERVVLFSDAIIAIILTIMVIDLPIEFSSGELDYVLLLRSVAIYFISFCFVADLWFQTAQAFNKVEVVRNKDLVIYLISLFFLSLVPKATGLIIEDTTKETLFIYGLLTLIVVILTQLLLISLTKEAMQEHKIDAFFIEVLKKRSIMTIGLRLVLLLLSFFAVTVTLGIYMFLPIFSFLQNVIDREEEAFVNQMDTEQKDFYLSDKKNFWGNSARKYSRILQTSLGDARRNRENLSPEWWNQFNEQWQKQLDEEITTTKRQLVQAETKKESNSLAHRLNRLEHEAEKMAKKVYLAKAHQSKQPEKK
ncbi:TMEM175 family protein [Enterococcus sp. LJL99]